MFVTPAFAQAAGGGGGGEGKGGVADELLLPQDVRTTAMATA